MPVSLHQIIEVHLHTEHEPVSEIVKFMKYDLPYGFPEIISIQVQIADISSSQIN